MKPPARVRSTWQSGFMLFHVVRYEVLGAVYRVFGIQYSVSLGAGFWVLGI